MSASKVFYDRYSRLFDIDDDDDRKYVYEDDGVGKKALEMRLESYQKAIDRIKMKSLMASDIYDEPLIRMRMSDVGPSGNGRSYVDSSVPRVYERKKKMDEVIENIGRGGKRPNMERKVDSRRVEMRLNRSVLDRRYVDHMHDIMNHHMGNNRSVSNGRRESNRRERDEYNLKMRDTPAGYYRQQLLDGEQMKNILVNMQDIRIRNDNKSIDRRRVKYNDNNDYSMVRDNSKTVEAGKRRDMRIRDIVKEKEKSYNNDMKYRLDYINENNNSINRNNTINNVLTKQDDDRIHNEKYIVDVNKNNISNNDIIHDSVNNEIMPVDIYNDNNDNNVDNNNDNNDNNIDIEDNINNDNTRVVHNNISIGNHFFISLQQYIGRHTSNSKDSERLRYIIHPIRQFLKDKGWTYDINILSSIIDIIIEYPYISGIAKREYRDDETSIRSILSLKKRLLLSFDSSRSDRQHKIKDHLYKDTYFYQ